jgi:hypothetical protein
MMNANTLGARRISVTAALVSACSTGLAPLTSRSTSDHAPGAPPRATESIASLRRHATRVAPPPTSRTIAGRLARRRVLASSRADSIA